MEEALGDIAREVPELVLVDIGLPGMSGTQGLRILKDRSRRRAHLQFALRGSLGVPAEKHAAGPPAGKPSRVMTGGAPMSPPVARRVLALFREFRPLGAHRLQPFPARGASAVTVGGRPQFEDCRHRVRYHSRHGGLAHAQYLRKAPGALQIRSGSQSVACRTDKPRNV
jgi:hypothetical protein